MSNQILPMKSKKDIINILLEGIEIADGAIKELYEIMFQYEKELKQVDYFNLVLDRLEQYESMMTRIDDLYLSFIDSLEQPRESIEVYQDTIKISQSTRFVMNDVLEILESIRSGSLNEGILDSESKDFH